MQRPWWVTCVVVVAWGCGPEAHGVCGNGVMNKGESCDDGNLDEADGCSSTCQRSGEIKSSVILVDASDQYAFDHDVDPAGNIYLSWGSISEEETTWHLDKLRPDGTTVWSNTGPTTPHSSYPESVRVGTDGRITVVGSVFGENVWTYDEDGTELYVRSFPGYPGALLPLPEGAFVVGGQGTDAGYYPDAVLRQYAATGTPGWQTRFTGTGDFVDAIWGLASAPDGTIYATGMTGGLPEELGYSMLIAAYEPDGTERFVNTYPFDETAGEISRGGHDIEVRPNGSLAVLSWVSVPGVFGPGNVLSVSTYSPDGDETWTRQIPGQYTEQLLADPSGDVVVATSGYSRSGFPTGYIERFDPARDAALWELEPSELEPLPGAYSSIRRLDDGCYMVVASALSLETYLDRDLQILRFVP